jgi:hypothetical protein
MMDRGSAPLQAPLLDAQTEVGSSASALRALVAGYEASDCSFAAQASSMVWRCVS